MTLDPLAARAGALALLAAVCGPAFAQDAFAQDVPDAGAALPADVGGAAELLRGAAEDALLLRDLLGTEVSEPGGNAIGTVENFVVIPGGRIVAAVIETSDGDRLPVPFAAVKLEAKSGEAQAALDRPLSELREDEGFGALRDAVPDLGG